MISLNQQYNNNKNNGEDEKNIGLYRHVFG